MLQFNIAFLLQATAVTALCCLPIVYNRESGFVWTAFLLPPALGCLMAWHIRRPNLDAFEFRLEELSDSAVEVHMTNGRYDRWFARGRMVIAGACLSIAVGPPALNVVDPEPIALWLPLSVLFGIGGVTLIGASERRRILLRERRLVTDFLAFGQIRWGRLSWRVRDGDCVAVFRSGSADTNPWNPDFRFFHSLSVYRGRRRYLFACMFTRDEVVPDLEDAAQHIAKLVGVPYTGYREETDWHRDTEAHSVE